MILYTWFDIETIIHRKRRSSQWPSGIKDIQVFADGVEVYYPVGETEEAARQTLCSWFGDWFNEENDVIYLQSVGSKKRLLPVLFEEEENLREIDKKRIEFRPFFADLILYPYQEQMKLGELPAAREDPPLVMAYYSFKGGVGRTLHLLAALRALLTQTDNKQNKILVVDADLEAPGLTWWARAKNQVPDLSYLDFLALCHNDPTDNYEEAMNITVSSLRETPLTVDKHECYFLPAFRHLDQLLHYPIRPEHLVRSPERKWIIGELLFQLGKAMNTSHVLIDLRAGLSELAAPILFDPRIVRFLITTYSSQSVEGTKLVLDQLTKIAPPRNSEKPSVYFDPTVIISMVPEELNETKDFFAFQQDLIRSYPDVGEDDATPARLTLATSNFAHELLYLESIDQAWHKLSGTSVYKVTNDLLALLPRTSKDEEETAVHEGQRPLIAEKLNRLDDLCSDLEYAESGKGEEYLHIPAILNLGRRFLVKIPTAIVMGSKGAGKTYLYLQLLRLGTWHSFLADLNLQGLDETPSTELFPFLESLNLGDPVKETTDGRRQEVWERLYTTPVDWKQSTLRDAIRRNLSGNTNWDQILWRKYWFHLIGKSLGIQPPNSEWISVEDIQSFLKSRNRRVIILFDGLEDIFQSILTDFHQQQALKGLLDIPEHLREYRESHLGLICLIRRDLVRTVIKQNIGQYEARYSAFDLKWDFTEALRLILWVGVRAHALELTTSEQFQALSRDDLANRLIPFWGRKMGAQQSKEAITANWVLAALSDFQGQLQARDLVRFVKHSARGSKDNISYLDRILQPAGIRRSIRPCSEEKLAELEEEFSGISSILNKLRNSSEEERKIPFSSDKFGLTAQEVEQLITLGILKKEEEKYYMPEIFRYALGFTLDRGARPTVLALKRKFF